MKIYQEDLNKMKKQEIIDLVLQLQGYIDELEKLNSDHALVVLQSDVFLQCKDLYPEVLSFVRDISDASQIGEESFNRRNWVTIAGRIRSSFHVKYISAERITGWETHFSKPVLIPNKFVTPLKNFLHAINTRLGELQSEYEKSGKNFLIQMCKNDIIGEASK